MWIPFINAPCRTSVQRMLVVRALKLNQVPVNDVRFGLNIEQC